MIKTFLTLEWRAFFRSAAFKANLAIKILMGFMALYLMVVFLSLGVGAFFLIRDELHLEPLPTVNRFIIYYVTFDLIVRLLLQKIPVINIRPLLTVPILKKTIVNFALGKMLLSFFNIIHWFFFLPFCAVLIYKGFDPLSVILWCLGMLTLIYTNNFWNVLMNGKDSIFYLVLGVIVCFAGLQYYGIFNITDYTAVFFTALFDTRWAFLLPILLLAVLYFVTFRYLKAGLYLDTGLSQKQEVAKTEQYEWLNQFGTMGTFLKNDIRLIRRNKRSKGTLVGSLLLLFYGLLFYTHMIEVYENPPMQFFAGIFVSGGFLLIFGQHVPSWDSSYYPLMMSQNITYRDYLLSKWWLMAIATVITTILASFYLYFGWHVYLMIIVGAIYNIGMNSHIVLLSGAFNKTPIDLAAGKVAFGAQKSFNAKIMLITLPKIVIPIALYGLGTWFISQNAGLILVALAGLAGFIFRDKVFTIIERIYRNEKYSTLQAYKQNNN